MYSNKFKYKLFGRLKSRKRNSLKSLKDFYKYKLNISIDINKKNYNILDIGSGGGENAIHLSSIFPKAKIITCDLYEDGNINLCNKIINNKIKNIRLFYGNVLELLEQIEPYAFLDEIWILFPDPWPKVRHHKRRLISNSFFKKIFLYHKHQGKLMIASDSESYIQSIIETVYHSKTIYSWENQRTEEWNYGNLDLPKTKYSGKAEKSNRNSMFFKLHKI